MASKLEECCKPGITWTGTPSGRETKMADTDVYLTQNFDKTDGPILLLMIDVYGYHLPNIRLVADRYAELGTHKLTQLLDEQQEAPCTD